MNCFSDSEAPFCHTAYFVDYYAMFTCGQRAATVSAFYHAASGAADVSSGKQQQAAGSSAVSSGQSGNNNTAASDPSTPIGPIVGGVIGGVAIIILAPTLIWFVLRTKSKDQIAAAGASSSNLVEMRKPPTAHSQASELYSGDKRQHGYSEMEVSPAELPLADARYAHEAPWAPATPSAAGRSELVGSEPKVYKELDSEAR
jgi:hypothetical protein